uniref:Uncharacterized protein n=1 Tax=Branchiostoma floridae TaxID=7739 RepID=C3XUR6_BRAFL|eukprot:XP_002612256.1 hypothetical protein BRAFLDRAFT_100071 [Branchiostoma floridae]
MLFSGFEDGVFEMSSMQPPDSQNLRYCLTRIRKNDDTRRLSYTSLYSRSLTNVRLPNEPEHFLYLLERCLQLQQGVFYEDNVSFVSVLERALDVCIEMGEWQNALEYAERLGRILRVYLQTDIGLGLLYKKKGLIQLELGRTAEAKESLSTAKRLLTVTHGWRHDLVQHIRNVLTDLQADEESTLNHENNFSEL